jgi:hypothetical protein
VRVFLIFFILTYKQKMKIQVEQLSFDLGILTQKAQGHLKEVLAYLLANNKSVSGLSFMDSNANNVHLVRINADLSLAVREFDDEPETSTLEVDSIEIHNVISLLHDINQEILNK